MSAQPAQAEAGALPVLGIIAGGGSLPAQLAECCKNSGRPYFVLALEGIADMAALASLPHAAVRLGAVGESLEILKRAKAQELVLAGHVKRPSFNALRPDMAGAKLLARLGGAFLSGDDAVLKTVIAFLEEEGFKVVGADDVMASLLAGVGMMGAVLPTTRDEADIALGMQVAHSLGALDVGQAVIVEHGYVLGVEAAEGTDALIGRCAALKREAKGGVLVKLRKPAQDARADLPSIGPDTVEKIAQAGFCGIAVQAGGSLVLEQQATVSRADALGIFIVGVRYD